ncbi:MAG: type II secretion system F family protein [Nanoarchaeota archaeon]|nr:type II secretion system F family protein [DPANN group archaeon]MBL7117029.1 type II secretion system F family protein [Nanoarchaeota archaeon]
MTEKINPIKKIEEFIDRINHSFHEARRRRIFKKASKEKEGVSFKKKSKKKPRRTNIAILKDYLRKAGYDYVDERRLSTIIKRIVIIFCALFSIIAIILLIVSKSGALRVLIYLLATWTFVFGLVLAVLWMILYLFLDLKIFKRTKQLEDVLPDFLQLTSANISAGMPIDQALWYAVRPKFGVLAKEIEEVAKSTIAGADLETALKDFSKKYDSLILKRSVSLIIEGMRAGGELADLLSKVAIDIQETKLMRKEIAASVMTYVIFISFATVAAAPFLFALSTQLLAIVQGIMGSIDLSNVSTGTFKLSLSGDSIDIKDFRIFSILALSVTAMFSASIVSIIQKGNVKEGLKYIPIFLVVSLILYFVANLIIGNMMSGFI